MSLEYKKSTGAFTPGVPARDLTSDEVKQFGGEKKLISTGLYKKPAPKSNKALSGPSENKGD